MMTIEDNAGNQNDPFGKKKAAFDESKLRMLNEIFENKEWNEATIDERERRILDVIQERWPDEVARRKEESPFQRWGKTIELEIFQTTLVFLLFIFPAEDIRV